MELKAGLAEPIRFMENFVFIHSLPPKLGQLGLSIDYQDTSSVMLVMRSIKTSLLSKKENNHPMFTYIK